jgi:cell division ATPase FtsA
MSRSGEEMTRRISEELGVDVRTAESYKRHYGVHASAGTVGSGTDVHYRPLASGEDAVESHRMAGILHGTLRPIIRGIGEEIQRSFRYAMGLYLDRPIAGLWVIGQGANMHGLAETLGPMLGIEVHRLTSGNLPSDFIVPSSITDEVAPQLAMCMGLCIGEMCP